MKYGSWDGRPVVWTPGEAWVLAEGSWKRTDRNAVSLAARPLSKDAFGRRFPGIAQPPNL